MRKLIKKVLRENTETYYLDDDNGWVKAIKKLIDLNNTFESEYSDFDENENFEIKIKYSTSKVRVWKSDDLESIEGTIYLTIDKLLIYDGDGWSRLYSYFDIPSWVWDDLEEKLIDDLSGFVPITVDRNDIPSIDIDIPTQFE